MSTTDTNENRSKADAGEAGKKASEGSDKGTHQGQGNAFQINNKPEEPGKDKDTHEN